MILEKNDVPRSTAGKGGALKVLNFGYFSWKFKEKYGIIFKQTHICATVKFLVSNFLYLLKRDNADDAWPG